MCDCKKNTKKNEKRKNLRKCASLAYFESDYEYDYNFITKFPNISPNYRNAIFLPLSPNRPLLYLNLLYPPPQIRSSSVASIFQRSTNPQSWATTPPAPQQTHNHGHHTRNDSAPTIPSNPPPQPRHHNDDTAATAATKAIDLPCPFETLEGLEMRLITTPPQQWWKATETAARWGRSDEQGKEGIGAEDVTTVAVADELVGVGQPLWN
ncbi:hypothetical protein RHMOL_Rhmol02G0280200 [Rhododendron molle]|uniref:Uncharacterized protein n=1 Tax=Rhododendron molle TaxID=49168 RepID=A0ACC0PWB5_RHOML|nr:hypothetical protein RHMOL_Rhmol02G0280200 [Rhododendron molle]